MKPSRDTLGLYLGRHTDPYTRGNHMDLNLKLLNKASEPQIPNHGTGAQDPTNTNIIKKELTDLDLFEEEDVNAFPNNFIVIDDADASSQGSERVSAEENLSSKTMKDKENDDVKPNSRKRTTKQLIGEKKYAKTSKARQRRLELLLSKGYTQEEAAILERDPREMTITALGKRIQSLRKKTSLKNPRTKLSGAGIKRMKHYLHKGYSPEEAKRLAWYPMSERPEEILGKQKRPRNSTRTRSARSRSNESNQVRFTRREYSNEDANCAHHQIENDNRSVHNNWETDEPAEQLGGPYSPRSVDSGNSDIDRLSGAGRKRMKYFLSKGYNRKEAQRLAKNPMIAAKEKEQDWLLSGKQNKEYIKRPHQSERGMSYNSNDELTDFKAYVLPFDYPNTIWTSQQLTIVRNAILDAIRDQYRSYTKPTFTGCTFRPGYLILTCVDVSTVMWVRTVVPQLKPWEGAEVKVVGENLKPRTLICIAFLPELDSMSSENILALIEGQNKGVRATDWIIMNRVVKGPVIKLTMAIDPISQKVLTDRGDYINYGFSKVYIKQKNKGSDNGGKEDYRHSKNGAKWFGNSRNPETNDSFPGNDDYGKLTFNEYPLSVSGNHNDELSTHQYNSERPQVMPQTNNMWRSTMEPPNWSSEVELPFAFSEPSVFNSDQNQLFTADNNCGFTRRRKPLPYKNEGQLKPRSVEEYTRSPYQGNSPSKYCDFTLSTDAIFTRRQPSNCQTAKNNSDDLQRYSHRNMNEQKHHQQQHCPQYIADDMPIVNAQQQQQQYQTQNYANNQDNFTNYATMAFDNAYNMNHTFNFSGFGMASGTGFDRLNRGSKRTRRRRRR